ncbi:hypothetical protein ACFWPU_00765 [Streptomyces sp. NPDC058471]|uniref:hypothetical protein n=1 Tax=Streptomyces sp. NPDC058471 TaxID=3346516 RepID=UPI00365F58ED
MVRRNGGQAHKLSQWCWSDCKPVDEKPTVTPVEFKITVEYRAELIRYSTMEPDPAGWFYHLDYTLPSSGRKLSVSGNGYQHKQQAKDAAEHKADSIALALVPADTYTYTPNLESS